MYVYKYIYPYMYFCISVFVYTFIYIFTYVYVSDALASLLPSRCRTKMQEAIHKMQDRLFNKGRKYNDIIQVYIEINELCLRTIVQSIFCTLVGQSII